MCRWLAYSGPPIYLEELIFKPKYSLIDQSLAAKHSEVSTNGDGFGIGWYGSREFPAVFKDVRPAWNDPNLQAIAAQVRSPLFFAHIRAATGTAVQRSNCHPFQFGRWLFVHNGVINDFARVRRTLAMAVAPELYGEIHGTTDSEIMFLLALTFGLEVAVLPAIARMTGFIEQVGRTAGIEYPLQMTLGMSDGQRLYAVRYSSGGASRSLFYSTTSQAIRNLSDEESAVPHGARAVVSEPLTELTDHWQAVPESTSIVIHRGDITLSPFAPADLAH